MDPSSGVLVDPEKHSGYPGLKRQVKQDDDFRVTPPHHYPIKSSAKLPALKYLLNPIYDGDDYIYIIDGYDGSYNNTGTAIISRYSISTDEIVSVAQNSVYHLNLGTAFMDFEQNLIYYLSGLDPIGKILKVDLNTNNWTIIADWTIEWIAARILLDDNTGYIMSGYFYHSVHKFDIKTATSTRLKDLPAPFGDTTLSGVHTENRVLTTSGTEEEEEEGIS
ncbi:Ring canal kelch protein [Folsomia candida]|uniref:Ring canal kelch protein n=1 Tax=Folsomia candida TaxID=158441 RepID=A0A226EFE1_FOLCA|nr:Ring canal kelch protein [Folsomia candida]